MRFALTLELEKKNFPIDYRRLILSYIKNALSKCNNGKYYEKFFKDTIQKDYCFSVILPKAKFNKNYIQLESNEIEILFSTEDKDKTGFILFSAFIAQKNKPYPLENDNFMTLKNIRNKKQEEIINSKAVFKTSIGSGICVRDHDRKSNKDIYYVYNYEKFREKLNVVLSNKLIKFGFTKDEIDEIKVNPLNCKKIVVKHYGKYIDVTTGMFEIQANKRILQYLYNSGVGSRTSLGFGMVDLVTQDLI
ncbi:CRISPR-associated endoribonuclease Cas6 [Clostridium sp.]|jgi:CRISPR-associated endoribonuclease Cas6|uniref:CRISPR-associated endoribonuclease Cas6 n=1 Tax=Clostridium sp. TaxID=1506 RepID=UPI0025BEA6D9|nr:CRISPR-associated endoribonuclease Cas6 [Clostridium sp.]MCI9070089.1 CRISPR-associated endoribonuclease Cas6 [Clostridium sp.]